MKLPSVLTIILPLVLANKPLSILINVGISSRSHVGGLLEISKELTARGHQIHYASPERYHGYTKGINLTVHGFPDIPDNLYKGMFEVCQTFIRSDRDDTPMKILPSLYDFFYANYRNTFLSISNLIETRNFDLIICDFYSQGCRDAANQKRIPMVIGLQSTHAFGLFDLPYLTYNRKGGPTNIETMSFFAKVYDFVFAQYGNWRLESIQTKAINLARSEFGIKSHHKPLEPLNRNLLLSVSFFGFEPAFHTPPNLYHVGPIRSPSTQSISNEIATFLKTHERIIYIGFGTFAPMLKEDVDDIIGALNILIEKDYIDGAIWGQGSYIFPHDEYPHIKFIPSAPQKALLDSINTKLFISHCGLESSFESFDATKPLLCFPLIADQHANAAKVQEAGVGRMLLRSQSSPQSLSNLAQSILDDVDGSIKANLIRLKAITDIRSSRGKSDGANLLEDYVRTAQSCRPLQPLNTDEIPCEVAHLIPVSERMSFIQSHLLDVYLFLLVVSLMISLLILRVTYSIVRRVTLQLRPKCKIN